ncbi:MAG: hypothetical protein DMF78_15480 [Acidobacteria bacterium]|nr:MAG: hypothetical protein DMF78_15480 [Acidobacteriota bacterium]
MAVVLCAAAFLRLTGLDHGVRRGPPAGDEEHNFVAPIRAMWSTPTADPGVKPGYPGFFNDLAFMPVGLGDRIGGERGAYAAGRGLVALFGLLNVLLAFLLVRGLAGAWAGVFAAALMAVSRGEVVHAHFITPDLVVISGLLAVLLIVRQRPLSTRAALAGGIACGLTIAVKYTGLVALPALAAALLRDRLPPRRTLAAGAGAVVAFALAAPFAFLRASPEGAGMAAAIRDYYSPAGYAGATARALGFAGASGAELAEGYIRQNVAGAALALAAASAVLFRPRAAIAPAAAALLFALAAILPAQIAYPRHVLVPSALLIVLAACGLRAVHDALRRAGRRLRVDREERARPAAGGHRLHARGPRRPVRGAALGRARGGRAGRPPARGGAPLRPRDRARRRPAGARRPRSAVADAARVRRRLGGGGRPRAIAGGDDRPIEGRRERLDPGGRGRVGGVVALEKRQRHGLDRRGMGPSAAHRPRRAPRRSLRRVHAPGRPARRPVPIRWRLAADSRLGAAAADARRPEPARGRRPDLRPRAAPGAPRPPDRGAGERGLGTGPDPRPRR